MPRPSKQAQRQEQILEAFGNCVARYGLAGATLEKVAEEAGLARALIRHNVGNREALIEAFVESYLDTSEADTQLLFDSLPANDAADTLIEWLFDLERADAKSVLIAEALIAAGGENEDIGQKMRTWNDSFLRRIEDVIANDYPQASPHNVTVSAAGIMGIYFNIASLAPLGDMPELRQASREAAHKLLHETDK